MKSSNHIGAGATSNGSSSKSTVDDSKVENQGGEDGTSDEKDKSFKKRWFNIPRGSDKKLG